MEFSLTVRLLGHEFAMAGGKSDDGPAEIPALVSDTERLTFGFCAHDEEEDVEED